MLSNQKQKIVFLVNGNNDDIQDIRKHCKDLFKCDNEITNGKKYKEITVQLLIENLNESKRSIQELKDYLRGKSSLLAERVEIHPVEDIKYNDKRYYSSFIGKDNQHAENFDFKKVLKYLPEDNRPIYFNINMIGNGNLNIGQITNVINNHNPEELRKAYARNWVSDNLPANAISTRELYDTYKSSLNDRTPVNVNQFNKIITSFGYENKKGNDNIHRWILS